MRLLPTLGSRLLPIHGANGQVVEGCGRIGLGPKAHHASILNEVNTAGDTILNKIIAYQHTGGGRTVGQTWGDGALAVDYIQGGMDRFGRIARMTKMTMEAVMKKATITRIAT